MKRFLKITSIIALCMLLVGIGLTGCGFMLGGTPNFIYDADAHTLVKPSVAKPVTQDLQEFKNLDLSFNDADVTICRGSEYSIRYDRSDLNAEDIQVNGKTLTIHSDKDSDSRLIYFTPGSPDTDSQGIVITVPKDANLQNITIVNASGDCSLSDLACDTLTLRSDYGDVDLSLVTAATSKLTLRSGDLSADRCKLDTCNMELNYGDIDLDNTSIRKLSCSNDSGDFDATNYSSDSSQIQLNYGSLNLEDAELANLTASLASGDCNLNLTGSQNDYFLSLSADLGEIAVGDRTASDVYDSHPQDLDSDAGTITVSSSYGDIHVDFDK